MPCSRDMADGEGREIMKAAVLRHGNGRFWNKP